LKTTADHTKTFVIYHGDPDGFGAAYAHWRIMGPADKYHAAHTARPMPKIEDGSIVYIFDYHYPVEELLALKARMKEVCLIDHHATTKDKLAGLDFCHVDTSHAAAVLVWNYFRGKKVAEDEQYDNDCRNDPGPPPPVLLYVEDQDLWKFELPNSKEITAALKCYPFRFDVWNSLSIDQLTSEGRAVIRYQDQIVNSVLQEVFTLRVAGYEVPCVNSSTKQIGSYVCHRMLELYPEAKFVVYYFDAGNGIRHYGLRSRADFNCSEIAKQFPNGGGHSQASGFNINAPVGGDGLCFVWKPSR
jgi:nanoRNase/pAp phosphatase (c-di-AMP/oligoRNAs hydrolase)